MENTIDDIMSNNYLTYIMKRNIANIVRQNFLETIGEIEEYLLNSESIYLQKNSVTQAKLKILCLELYTLSDKYLRVASHNFLNYIDNALLKSNYAGR